MTQTLPVRAMHAAGMRPRSRNTAAGLFNPFEAVLDGPAPHANSKHAGQRDW